jgi:hypothetical protein
MYRLVPSNSTAPALYEVRLVPDVSFKGATVPAPAAMCNLASGLAVRNADSIVGGIYK